MTLNIARGKKGFLSFHFSFFSPFFPGRDTSTTNQKLHCMALGGVGVLASNLGALLQGKLPTFPLHQLHGTGFHGNGCA